ncbi:MAG: hypothetical protein QXE03_03185 [Candidatus Nitrosocaldus sp.]
MHESIARWMVGYVQHQSTRLVDVLPCFLNHIDVVIVVRQCMLLL